MKREEQKAIIFARLQERKRANYYGNKFAMPPECDPCCRFRGCYNKYEDKGSFCIGRGYTHYNNEFTPACGTRLSRGCPFRRGDVDDSFDFGNALKWIEAEISFCHSAEAKKKYKDEALANVKLLISAMKEWQKLYMENWKRVYGEEWKKFLSKDRP